MIILSLYCCTRSIHFDSLRSAAMQPCKSLSGFPEDLSHSAFSQGFSMYIYFCLYFFEWPTFVSVFGSSRRRLRCARRSLVGSRFLVMPGE